MKLGPRLALTVLAFGLPLFAAIEWYRRDTDRRLKVEGLVNRALGHMDEGARAACESAPERFGGPLDDLVGSLRRGPRGRRGDRPPPFRDAPGGGKGKGPPPKGGRRGGGPQATLWAFDQDLQCANPGAPALPPALRAGLDRGLDIVQRRIERDGRTGLEVAFRTEWVDGPCAVLWITQWGGRVPVVGSTAQLVAGGALAAGLLLAALAAGWPIVRRLRGLTAAVGRSAATDYAEPVPDRGSDEIAELARAFNRAGDEVKARMASLTERSTALRQFLSNTTHDVMTPLTVLQGHLGALQRRAKDGEPVDAEVIRGCQEEAHYMASLLHNLTAAARLESGAVAVDLRPQDLGPIVERAVARHRPMAANRGLQLEIALPSQPVRARVDVTLLEQAVSNLVHNAVRHNSTGDHVAVVLEASGERFSLRVLDDGPGASGAVLEKLSQRRFRAEEARQRTPDGQGLGLHIARQAAEAHGFELTFASPSSLGEEGKPGFEAVLEGRLVDGG